MPKVQQVQQETLRRMRASPGRVAKRPHTHTEGAS